MSNPDDIKSAEEVEPADRHMREFARRVEAGEINSEPYDLNNLDHLVGMGEPITRADLQRQAIVLTHAEFLQLGGITIRAKDGSIMELDPDDHVEDSLVIYPDDLS